MFTKEVKEYIERSVLCWLATVDAAGHPNVSTKEVFSAKRGVPSVEAVESPEIPAPGLVILSHRRLTRTRPMPRFNTALRPVRGLGQVDGRDNITGDQAVGATRNRVFLQPHCRDL